MTEQPPPTCASCGSPIQSKNPQSDDYDDNREPIRCGEGCGQMFHVDCYANHYQDCFDDHQQAAVRQLPRRYAP